MSGGRKFLGILGALVPLVGWFLLMPSAAAAQAQAPPPAHQRVIVIFKNQESNLPASPSMIGARRKAVQAIQAPVMAQLSAAGASNIHADTVLNAVSAMVPSTMMSPLQTDPAVSKVIPDQIIRLAPAQGLSVSAPAGSSVSAASVCAPGNQVQLDPQAISTIHADSDQPGAQTAQSLGFTGAGVKAAFIADGLDINNPDFVRSDGQPVFVDYKDFSGEGTNVPTGGEEAFGDASSIAAQGREVYNVAGFGPHAVTGTCNIRVEGVAPGASLAGLDIFGSEDTGFNSSFLQAIDYAVATDHVDVLNESLGNNFYPDDQASLDAIKQANDNAVAAGTTVTVSSGDAGGTSTIGTPSTDPNVISVGATTTYQIDLQTGYGGAQFPGVKGAISNDVSSFSSGGFEQTGRTVDVVAPGELGWALCSTDTAMYADCVNYNGKGTPVLPFGGTSEAAPLTAGVAALVIQAYRKGHGGASPTPAVVKQIIVDTSDDIDSPADQQGAGLVDAYKAVLAAESYSGPNTNAAVRPVGNALLANTGQLNAVAQPGSSQRLTDTITNDGSTTQRVSLSGRALGPYQSVDSTRVSLSDASSPKSTDFLGDPVNFEQVNFNVPAGQSRLSASIAYQAAVTNADANSLNARVRLTLIDPRGDLAAYSVPQGIGNFGNVQVTNPVAGKWTAFVWGLEGANGGTQGPVLFGAQVAKYISFGKVSPGSLVLRPGQSAPVTATVTTPSTPGDSAAAIVLDSNQGPSFGRQSTIPITLRSLIPSGTQSFTQTLTGGNGRSLVTGQTFYYGIDVPAGVPELNASVALSNNPNNPFTEWLISPSGEALAQSANELPSASAPGFTNLIGAQTHVLSPAPGQWTLIVAFIPQVSGAALSEPFTVSTNDKLVPSSSGGLPNSARTVLAAGKAHTFDVHVTNNGPEPEAYFVDPRLPGSTSMNLTSLDGPNTTVPLTVASSIPVYEVPTHTTGFTGVATTTGSTPIQFDTEGPAGDPDVISNVGSDVSASLSADEIAQGVWNLSPTVVGPFGATGPAQEPVSTSMTVTSEPFDPAVTSPTDDLWQLSTNPAVASDFSPIIVGPGQTATIPVTITPSGPAGTKVTGTLYLDDLGLFVFQNFTDDSGSEVAAFPYSYTIG